MGRFLAVLLALLFALSAPTAALSASTAPSAARTDASPDASMALQSDAGNSTSMLTLDANGSVRSAYVTPSLSLDTALDARHAGLRSELDVALLRERLSKIDGPEGKREVIFQFTYRIEDQIDDLRGDDRRARRAFVNGSLSADEYVQRLARIDARADRIRGVIDRTESLATQVPDFSLYTRAQSLRFQLGAVEGPVRSKAAAVAAGRASPERIYVAATDSGVVLGMIDGSELVREITRLDSYAPDGDKRMSFDEAQRRISELYPIVSRPDNSGGGSSQGTNVGISRFSYTNPSEYGEVTIYFDGRSGEVFKEIRRQRVSLMETTSVRNAGDGLTVTANYTFPTGPVRVTLTDTETGEPVNGSVAVNGQPIAATGSNGQVWLIAPRGEFAVSATAGNATVNVTARPAPRALGDRNGSRTVGSLTEG